MKLGRLLRDDEKVLTALVKWIYVIFNPYRELVEQLKRVVRE